MGSSSNSTFDVTHRLQPKPGHGVHRSRHGTRLGEECVWMMDCFSLPIQDQNLSQVVSSAVHEIVGIVFVEKVGDPASSAVPVWP